MGIELANRSACTGCQACRLTCPRSAISMKRQQDGFLIPLIDEKLCVDCHRCENVCPVLQEKTYVEYPYRTIIVKSQNEELRMNSSSGGFFSHIAGYVLDNGGVVFGAAFSEDYYSVKHILICSKAELYKIRGSKYLQSNIGDTYEIVKQYLNNQKLVLFSGTGCQIAALKTYLGKDYNNLVLVDIVCHGVPSQYFWEKYLLFLEENFRGKTKSVNFRFKKMRWNALKNDASIGRNVYFKLLKDDPYLEIFQRNLSLRESCYSCKFKSIKGIADFSIGDLWGANEIAPDFNDDKGISFVLINSLKGFKLFECIKDTINYQNINIDNAIANNRSISYATNRPENREEFINDLNKLTMKKVLKKYTKNSVKEKVKRFLDSIGLLNILKRVMHKEKVELDKNLEYGLLVVFETKGK